MARADRGGDEERVLRDLCAILRDMQGEWDLLESEITVGTYLGRDLGCSSVEIVELAITIEDHFDAPDLPFHELLMAKDGSYIDDMTVGTLAQFVSSALARRAATEARA